MISFKISSFQNNLIKEVVSLQVKSKERKRQNLIPIEGKKEISLAVKGGVAIQKIFYCPEIINYSEVCEIIGSDKIENIVVCEVTADVFSKISYRETTGGIIAIANPKGKTLKDLKPTGNSVYIILESVEKPGNLGAICRVADAAKVDAVIICDELTDIYNPNSIRSSLGCVFTIDVVNADFKETIEWLKNENITSYAAELTAAEFYQDVDFGGNIALVFGTEATGLTKNWLSNADKRIKIPMRGVIDSLNVTTSVAILVFEAMRQRNFN